MKLTLKVKKIVGKKIKEHKMERKELPKSLKGSGAIPMVEIPETEDASGKPMFVPAVQFNKIYDKVNRARNL